VPGILWHVRQLSCASRSARCRPRRMRDEGKSWELRLFSNYVVIALVDVGSTQQVIESADPVPSVTVAFEHDPVFARFVCPAVILSEKVHQQFALFSINARVHEDFARLFVKIVQKQYRIISPVVPQSENAGIADFQHGKIAPANLRNFFAHSNDALGPVQH
jgi:hypothetical protein